MLSDRCPVCLSVCPVCDIGILWPNAWVDQYETWHAGSLGPGNIVLDGDPAVPPPPKGHNPIFGPYLLWPSGWMPLGMEIGLGSGEFVCYMGTQLPLPKIKGAEAPNFRPMSVVAKQLDG